MLLIKIEECGIWTVTSLLKSKQTGRRIVILIYYRGPGRRMECMTFRGELQ
jgi:hypothetical protein